MQPIPEDDRCAWLPDELFDRLGRFSRNWYLVGGWALDIWHGHQTRLHEDLEFAFLQDGIDFCRNNLGELEFFTVADKNLVHLPANETAPVDRWQIWGADMSTRCWRVDMMMDRGNRKIWCYKREFSIQLPRSEAVRVSAAGISYLAPTLILLFKAKYMRRKDQEDFALAIPKLGPLEKQGLVTWLECLHPGHEWIATLKRST